LDIKFMTDDRLIAAHLTAALIAQAQAQDGKAKGTAAGNAAKLYFDVLNAIRVESKNRHGKSARLGLIKQSAAPSSGSIEDREERH
jgi:hypothetical protein